MNGSTRPVRIHTDSTFDVPTGKPGFRRALLLNPPIYDTQYWARWSQPAGLLRIATYLKQQGYAVDLIDCMETDRLGRVPKSYRKVDGERVVVHRDDIQRSIWHYGLSWDETKRRMGELAAHQPPDEVWIGSVMTYWWESTRDAVALAREIYPDATILVGGIYPTLAPDHASARLAGADVIFAGELSAASHCWTDLSLYEHTPSYAILTTSRGCPWDCHYCAARALNNFSTKVRVRDVDDVLAEIEDKVSVGVRRFGFYEDNSLISRDHLQDILEEIIRRGLKLELYAPEGFETRLLDLEVLQVMKRAGFEKVHLPFEALKWDTNVGWNRRHASTASFDLAFENAVKAGFTPRSDKLNAFVLFGLPDDCLEDLMDSVAYVHHTVGSIIPMLFTPVPGTEIYRQHAAYLQQDMGWDLQDLNGKLLPFLEYNSSRYPRIHASDYLAIESLMSVLNNGKMYSRAFDLCDDSTVGSAARDLVSAWT